MSSSQGVAVIFDIVRSRDLFDRSRAQRDIAETFAMVEEHITPSQPAWATVGDEFQAVYSCWQDAVRSLIRLTVALPDGLYLRAGLGLGDISDINSTGSESGPAIQEGPGWLSARSAIDGLAHIEDKLSDVLHRAATLDADRRELVLALNGQLLALDHILGRLKVRERRLLKHLLFGLTQADAARTEGISQAAVSKAVHRSGGMAVLRIDQELAHDRTRS